MALVTCADCGHQVSDKADSCLKCGRPIAAGPSHSPSPRNRPVVLAIIGATVAIVLAVAWPRFVPRYAEAPGGMVFDRWWRQSCDILGDSCFFGAGRSSLVYDYSSGRWGNRKRPRQPPTPKALDEVVSALNNLATQEELYYADEYRYSSDFGSLGYYPPQGIIVNLKLTDDSRGWGAVAWAAYNEGVGCAKLGPEIEPPIAGIETPGGRIPTEKWEIVCDPA